MSDKKYNGWTNYETWNVALWLDNEQPSYDYWREQAVLAWSPEQDSENIWSLSALGIWTRSEAARFTLANQLKDEIREAAPDLGASMWADLLGSALDEVNWAEIANNFLEGVDECAGYDCAESRPNPCAT